MNNQSIDLQISTDVFNGDPSSRFNPINTGFYFIKSSTKMTSLFQKWYDMRKNSTGMKEQDVLVNLVRQGVLSELGLNARFLENLYFSGFCRDSRDVRLVMTVHANCCRGIEAKVIDLKAILRDWKRFKDEKSKGNIGVLGNTTNGFRWPSSGHLSCLNSKKKYRNL
ncbi:Nucleotide-diphospho-sugar transferase family protein [Perilla frutescens var. hirtella]|uniref:Nucleotide-diphospho-sugar transferase family protein n=1 Tax=Perilla frutescens var. hirtella TaxID=608512 RepID=A0AAD4IZU1_PERFH|nr:Nucleotide-diphospho-sugar transferase family protein [Perilla frutescens var. hirtella]